MKNEEILKLYDAEIAKGGCADSAIIRLYKAAFAAGQTAEREECIKIALAEKWPEKYCAHSRNMKEEGCNQACNDIVDDIRSRGK